MHKPAILLVEADFAVRHPLAEYLRECGYKVIEAIDSDEAMILLGDRTIRIDVVLSDVKSPGKLDGFQLAQWIREHAAGTRTFLAASAAKATERAASLCEEGPAEEKPAHHQGLLDRIKSLKAARDRAAATGQASAD